MDKNMKTNQNNSNMNETLKTLTQYHLPIYLMVVQVVQVVVLNLLDLLVQETLQVHHQVKEIVVVQVIKLQVMELVEAEELVQ